MNLNSLLVKPISVQFTEIMQFDVFLTSGSRPSKLTCKISSAHFKVDSHIRMYPLEFKRSLPHRKQKITNAQVSGGDQRLELDLRLDELIHLDSLPTDGYRMEYPAPLS